MAKAPAEVKKALEEVRKYCPEVCQVFYGVDGKWMFADENFEAPAFWDRVDVGILEDAADAVSNSCGFPAAFSI